MSIGERIILVRQLSNEELLAGLCSALGSSRRWMAMIVAHLGEVEERRLHLVAGYESMFAYCTRRLGMSEDEACRRIEVARLARRFPILFELLADGVVSPSVAALLKPHLDEDNHVALLAAVSGKTVTRAREVLAAWFPRPDVPSSIRKLPERRVAVARSEGAPGPSPLFAAVGTRRGITAEASSARPEDAPAPNASTTFEAPHPPAPERVTTQRQQATAPSSHTRGKSPTIEPLSPDRYRIQLTADAELKRKLDLAQDLLRHAVPSGDLVTILGRALDLLIEKTLQRRFGQTKRKKAPARPTEHLHPPSASPPAQSAQSAQSPAPAAPPPPRHSHHLPNDVRRTVLERDGLRCTWQGPDGHRCESRAWLEHDHIVPRGHGGSNDAINIRNFCRAHNRLAAEQAYGQPAITRIIARRRAERQPPPACAGS